jgi:gas vesicle structural protein
MVGVGDTWLPPPSSCGRPSAELEFRIYIPMQIERPSSEASLMDVLDRVLDKGIVIDAWVRVSLVGIDLVTVEARVVVASIVTYLHHSAALADARPAARPDGDTQRRPLSLAESLGLEREVVPAPALATGHPVIATAPSGSPIGAIVRSKKKLARPPR